MEYGATPERLADSDQLAIELQIDTLAASIACSNSFIFRKNTRSVSLSFVRNSSPSFLCSRKKFRDFRNFDFSIVLLRHENRSSSASNRFIKKPPTWIDLAPSGREFVPPPLSSPAFVLSTTETSNVPPPKSRTNATCFRCSDKSGWRKP